MCHESARYMSCAAVSQKGGSCCHERDFAPSLARRALVVHFPRVARNVLLALRSRTRLFQRFFSQDAARLGGSKGRYGILRLDYVDDIFMTWWLLVVFFLSYFSFLYPLPVFSLSVVLVLVCRLYSF